MLSTIGLAVYARTLNLPAWETDTWVGNLLAQKAIHAESWRSAIEGSRFILDNPKGWSDFFVLASWFALYAVVGPNIVAFHLFGVACHIVTAILLLGYARRRGASELATWWVAILFLLWPLNQDVVAVEAHSQYPMFGALFLGAVALVDRWRDHGERTALGAALVIFVLALGTKELAFALPPILFFDIASECRRLSFGRDRMHRSWVSFILASLVAMPFLVHPFWVSMSSPERATSPADAAMLRDLAHFLEPQVLIPKLVTDLGRWMVVPFANGGPRTPGFAASAALCVAAAVAGVLGRRGETRPFGWPAARACLFVVLGYLPVGFQLDHTSFEKTGELYLASMGAALLWGELLGGDGSSVPRFRTFLGATMAIAMAVHLQFLHDAIRTHADRVQAAVTDLKAQMSSVMPPGGLVVVGEECLDRGAVDAVILQIAHDLGPLPARVTWIGGGGTGSHPVDACPAGAIQLELERSRFLRWDDSSHVFEPLTEPTALGSALAWRNPDPERVLVRSVCIVGRERSILLSTEILADLRPETIFPRL